MEDRIDSMVDKILALRGLPKKYKQVVKEQLMKAEAYARDHKIPDGEVVMNLNTGTIVDSEELEKSNKSN